MEVIYSDNTLLDRSIILLLTSMTRQRFSTPIPSKHRNSQADTNKGGWGEWEEIFKGWGGRKKKKSQKERIYIAH